VFYNFYFIFKTKSFENSTQGDGEKERYRDRETDRQKDTDEDRQTDRDGQIDIETERQRCRQMDGQRVIWKDRKTDRETMNGQIERQAVSIDFHIFFFENNLLIYARTDVQTVRWTDGQRNKQRNNGRADGKTKRINSFLQFCLRKIIC
jgi:hypothetical protein